MVARDRLKICWSVRAVPVRIRPGAQLVQVAQLDRALRYGRRGLGFESLLEHLIFKNLTMKKLSKKTIVELKGLAKEIPNDYSLGQTIRSIINSENSNFSSELNKLKLVNQVVYK